jgi:hypothetical protein
MAGETEQDKSHMRTERSRKEAGSQTALTRAWRIATLRHRDAIRGEKFSTYLISYHPIRACVYRHQCIVCCLKISYISVLYLHEAERALDSCLIRGEFAKYQKGLFVIIRMFFYWLVLFAEVDRLGVERDEFARVILLL